MIDKKKTTLHVLGVVMIVKNESHIIEEALQSILPVIDTYCISDTGSCDDTVEKITNFFSKHGISGKVYSDTWKDFGTNRSIALEHASKHMKFGFMIDADDLFITPDDFSKREFYKQLDIDHADAYEVTIVNETDSLHYQRTQIFHLKRGWKYVGVLHEYPTLQNDRIKAKVLSLPWKVVSRRLGNRNKMDPIEKYKKDAETLTLALKNEPLNTRHMFYLAQSYRDAEEHEKAIHWYKIRVDFGGWYEEVYFSLYQIGFIYLDKLDDEKNGVYFGLKAFKFHPKRIESMQSIAQYYAIKKKDFSTAYQFIAKIKDTPLPKEDGLFVSAQLYNFYSLLWYYLLCFLTFRKFTVLKEDWPRFPELFHNSLRDCLTMQDIEILIENKKKYDSQKLSFPNESIPINENPVSLKNHAYRVLNPCIAKDDKNEIWYNIRCTNFDIHYQSMDHNGLIETFNFLCNADFSKIYKLIDKSEYRDKKCNKSARIIGYEDMRLFRYANKWYFLANNDELTAYLNRPQMVLGYLENEPNENDGTWAISYVVHLQYPYQQQIEKNWTPIVNTGSLKIVYSMYPYIVIEPDIVTGYCKIFTNLEFNYSLKTIPQRKPILRGSTPWIPFHEGLLAVGHYVYFLNEMNHQRVYYHFFMYINHDLSEIRFSAPFHFEKHIIEFATGLIQKDDYVIISYSLSDSIPKIIRIPCQDILCRLERL